MTYNLKGRLKKQAQGEDSDHGHGTQKVSEVVFHDQSGESNGAAHADLGR